jgi:hypothetical protein
VGLTTRDAEDLLIRLGVRWSFDAKQSGNGGGLVEQPARTPTTTGAD